jgi:type IV pilus assembly protein PilE
MDQVRKSRRSDAVAALSAVQQAQERWRANNATYATTVAALGITSPTTYYTLAIATSPAPTGTAYTATATAVAGKSQVKDTGCDTLTVTVTNGSANKTPDTCWRK